MRLDEPLLELGLTGSAYAAPVDATKPGIIDDVTGRVASSLIDAIQ
jgi:hypothetical protein